MFPVYDFHIGICYLFIFFIGSINLDHEVRDSGARPHNGGVSAGNGHGEWHRQCLQICKDNRRRKKVEETEGIKGHNIKQHGKVTLTPNLFTLAHTWTEQSN